MKITEHFFGTSFTVDDKIVAWLCTTVDGKLTLSITDSVTVNDFVCIDGSTIKNDKSWYVDSREVATELIGNIIEVME